MDYYSPLKAEHAAKYGDDPREDIISFIGESPGRILEVGCGTGATAALIKKKYPDTHYTGIEIDTYAAAIAASRLDRVIIGNIEKIDLGENDLVKETFNLIILADVLEHLYDPWQALAKLRDYLKPDGKIIASIPNMQHISIIMHLLSGYWTYKEHGHLDATHIRFFTYVEIMKMFFGTGYKPVYCGGPEKIPPHDTVGQDMDFGLLVVKDITDEKKHTLFTTQYFVVAEKHDMRKENI